MKNEITIYRHKTEKDIYLLRNWHVSGGGPDTEFYRVTDSFNEAVRESAVNNERMDSYLSWLSSFPELKAKIIRVKAFCIDGYNGFLEKELEYYVKDFEPITLVEPD